MFFSTLSNKNLSFSDENDLCSSNIDAIDSTDLLPSELELASNYKLFNNIILINSLFQNLFA